MRNGIGSGWFGDLVYRSRAIQHDHHWRLLLYSLCSAYSLLACSRRVIKNCDGRPLAHGDKMNSRRQKRTRGTDEIRIAWKRYSSGDISRIEYRMLWRSVWHFVAVHCGVQCALCCSSHRCACACVSCPSGRCVRHYWYIVRGCI